MSWLSEFTQLIPPQETRGPLTLQSFVEHLLPTVCCYFATALLVVLPDTLRVRFALLPLSLWSAFRAATSIDVAFRLGPGYAYLNHGLLLGLLIIAMRVTEWTFYREPLRRKSNTKDISYDSGSAQDWSADLRNAAWDALDLGFNLRGCGWEWSEGLKLPVENRPIESTLAFALATLRSAVKYILQFDAAYFVVQSCSPATIGSPSGGTIFDPSLPPILRYTRSTLISYLSAYGVYCAIQACYDVATLVGIVVCRQSPTQWPPLFDDPWEATSLADLWAKRWHQMFRQCFICMGGKPLQFLLGRLGGVFGAFLTSGVLHDWGLWGMGRGTEFSSVGGFFLVNGVGIVLEVVWKKVTGYRVEGWRGRLWAMSWAVGWANILVDAWSRKGLFGSIFIPDAIRPSKLVFNTVYRLLSVK